MVDGLEFDVADVYAAQTMCPYETVAYGFSRFCDLFTYEEWVGFGSVFFSSDYVPFSGVSEAWLLTCSQNSCVRQ